MGQHFYRCESLERRVRISISLQGIPLWNPMVRAVYLRWQCR